MKFDVIVGNPPYQAPQDREGKKSGRSGTTLWDKFTIKSVSLLNSNGYLCYVHPSGWRGLGNGTANVREVLRNRNILHLSIHNEKDGLETFGAETRYDWYVLKNEPMSDNCSTTIVGQDGTVYNDFLGKFPFIPNGMFDEVLNLIARNGEERVQILHSFSVYETRKPWMSKERSSTKRYPCIYSVAKDGTPSCFYSEYNNRGHFGIPKVIFSCGRISSANYIVDSDGTYGLTQFAKGVVDRVETLPKIAAAMKTPKFKQIMEMCSVSLLEINKDTLGIFKRDFWRHFVDNEGNPL